MLQRSLLFLLLVICTRTAFLQRRDSIVSSAQRNPTNALSFGIAGQRTTVNVGVTYWLSGSSPHNFYGNVFTNGTIIASQTDYQSTDDATGQTSNYVGHSTTDGNLNISSTGSIFLNDFGATSGSTYLWNLRTFTNNGNLQFCGSGDTGGSLYQIYCDIDCYNYGTIEYSQYDDNQGTGSVWRSTNLVPAPATNYFNIYNYGSFRITSVVFYNVQNWMGNGCIIIGFLGVLYLQDGTGINQSYRNGAYLPALPDQSITFSDSTGILHLDTQVYLHNPNFGPQIYGFGGGCALEFLEVIDATDGSYFYDPSTGILNVIFQSENVVNIKLGLGYDPDNFYLAQNPTNYNASGFNAIFYGNGAPAQATPATCQPALPSCTDPIQTAGALPVVTAGVYVTRTTVYTGANTVTSTIVSASGVLPGTVVIYTPASYITQTSAYTGRVTQTITAAQASGTAPGTVVVLVPAAYVTRTSIYAGATTVTSTAAQASGTNAGIIVIYIPAVYVTQTSAYTGAATSISTAIQPSGTQPGTVIVYIPARYVTQTSAYIGVTTSTRTAAQASGTNPGTIIVYTPLGYVTTSQAYTGTSQLSGPITLTIAPIGVIPGTIVILTQAVFATLSLPYIGSGTISSPSTSYIAPLGTAPGTVVVYTPASYVTRTTAYSSGSITATQTSTILPSGTTPGTVIIYTPTLARPASITTTIGGSQCFCTAV